MMKFFVHAIFLLIACVIPILAQQNALPHFEDYEVALYKGKIHLPKWMSRVSDDEWRDDFGKLVEAPVINFAGKYFVTVHSCGTGCGYYSMIDLSTVRELRLLAPFSFAEPAPKTRDGYDYTTDLIYCPNSKLLIAQYHVELKLGRRYEWSRRRFLV